MKGQIRSEYLRKQRGMNALINLMRLVLIVVLFISCNKLSTSKSENITSKPLRNWVRIGPGGGGGTFMPTFSYNDENDFFIRCDMTGAYHTKDGGSSYSQINYPNGSYSFAYDPSAPNISYIGSRALNKSIDGGKTWNRILPFEKDILEERFLGDHADYTLITKENSIFNIFEENSSTVHGQYPVVKNITVDPNTSDNIYFSLNNYFLYTVDGGKSWSRKKVTNKIDYIYTNSTNLKTKVYVFSAFEITIFDKLNWNFTSIPLPAYMQPAFSITGGTIKQGGATVFYALQNSEQERIDGGDSPTTLWISRDLGKSWAQNTSDFIMNSKNSKPTYSMLAAAENDAANVYMVSSNYQEKIKDGKIAHWFGTFKSSDAGKTWKWVWKGGGGSGKYGVKDGRDAPNLKDAWVHKAFGGDYIRLMDVGVAPNNGNVAIITDWYRSMKTMVGGKIWKAIYSTKQPDGSYISNGLDVTTSYGVHFDPFDSLHIAISYTDIGYHHSYNGGKSWFRSVKGIPIEWENTCYWLVFDPEAKNKIWSVWSNLHDFPRGKMTRNPKWTAYGRGGVAVSIDGGKTWEPTIKGMGLDSPSTSIVLDKNSPIGNRTLYVASFGKGVFKSIDDGKIWQLRNNGIEGSLAAFELTIQPDGTLFLITSLTPQHLDGSKGREVHMGAVYKSVDGADTWIKLNIGDKVLFPNGLAYDPINLNRIYLGSWADIYLSDVIGGDLARTTGGNERFDFDGGISMSEDGGKTWTSIFDKNKYVYDVTVDDSHAGRLYCNTFDQGAYRSDDFGKTWNKIKGYDFHWGHRVIVDKNDLDKVYLTTFGSSIWYGEPKIN